MIPAIRMQPLRAMFACHGIARRLGWGAAQQKRPDELDPLPATGAGVSTLHAVSEYVLV